MKFDYRKYPLLGYRVSPTNKKHMSKKIVSLVKLMNKTKLPTERTYKKRDAFMLALQVGINRIFEVDGKYK